MSDHAVVRFINQKKGKGKWGYSVNELVNICRKRSNYRQLDGKIIKFYNGIAVI